MQRCRAWSRFLPVALAMVLPWLLMVMMYLSPSFTVVCAILVSVIGYYLAVKKTTAIKAMFSTSKGDSTQSQGQVMAALSFRQMSSMPNRPRSAIRVMTGFMVTPNSVLEAVLAQRRAPLQL